MNSKRASIFISSLLSSLHSFSSFRATGIEKETTNEGEGIWQYFNNLLLLGKGLVRCNCHCCCCCLPGCSRDNEIDSCLYKSPAFVQCTSSSADSPADKAVCLPNCALTELTDFSALLRTFVVVPHSLQSYTQTHFFFSPAPAPSKDIVLFCT